MSSHYHCGQYNDSFKPTRLKNWCHKTHPWEQCCEETKVTQFRSPGHLEFIADDRGHLLPNIKKERNLKPSWGFPVLRIWDEEYGCGCYKPHIPKTSHPTWAQLPKHFKDSERPKIDCSDDVKLRQQAHVQDEFDVIKRTRPPVIWIFGKAQTAIEPLRKTFGRQLAKYLGFTYLDLDERLTKWSQYIIPGDTPLKNGARNKKHLNLQTASLNLQRTIRFSRRLIEHKESALNIGGILELIKMAMIESWPTNGYVLEAFPYSNEEAGQYEDMFWESAAGIYFTSSAWTEDKSVEPPVKEPVYFRRDYSYSEEDVEAACDTYGYKTVKIIHAEDVHEEEIAYIDNVLDCFVSHYPETLAGRYEILTDHCKALTQPNQGKIIEEYESDSDTETDTTAEPVTEPEPVTSEPEPERAETPESDSIEEVPSDPDLHENDSTPDLREVDLSDDFEKPPQIDQFRPREFSDVKWREMDYAKLQASVGAVAFPDPPERAHHIPAFSPRQDAIPIKWVLKEIPKEKKPKSDEAEDSSSSSDPDWEYVAEELPPPPPLPIQTPSIHDPEYFVHYTVEPEVDPDTIHTIFPAKNRRPGTNESVWSRLQREKLAAPKQTLQEKIDIIFKPDESWMEREDEEKRKVHVPLICCFDKRRQAEQYDRTKKAVEGYVEPPKESFGQKCKKLFGRLMEHLKRKSEEIIPATVALENWFREHPEDPGGGADMSDLLPAMDSYTNLRRMRPASIVSVAAVRIGAKPTPTPSPSPQASARAMLSATTASAFPLVVEDANNPLLADLERESQRAFELRDRARKMAAAEANAKLAK